MNKLSILWAVPLLTVVVSGCASIQRMTSRDHMSTEERKAHQAKLHEEEAERMRQREALEPGATMEAVKTAWGEPDLVEFRDGKKVFFYQNGDLPVYFAFKGDKLEDKYYDHAYAQQAQAQREQDRRERQRAAGAALQSLSSGFRGTSTNCTSNRIGTTTYTNCR